MITCKYNRDLELFCYKYNGLSTWCFVVFHSFKNSTLIQKQYRNTSRKPISFCYTRTLTSNINIMITTRHNSNTREGGIITNDRFTDIGDNTTRPLDVAVVRDFMSTTQGNVENHQRRLTELEIQYGVLDERMDQIEDHRITELETNLASVEQRITSIDLLLSELKASFVNNMNNTSTVVHVNTEPNHDEGHSSDPRIEKQLDNISSDKDMLEQSTPARLDRVETRLQTIETRLTNLQKWSTGVTNEWQTWRHGQ
jgi:hypothetical protein